jgi:hypothetical protein
MRRISKFSLLLFCLSWALGASASSGQVLMVLPHYLDLKGRRALSPSLYDRDAYQAQLRQHPEQRSGVRFNVQWKAPGEPARLLKLRVELRGMAKGDLPRRKVLEADVLTGSRWSRWTALPLVGEDYKQFGEITAWRVTLLDGETVLSEQSSFLW